MSTFGRVDKDLHLLRLSESELRAAYEHDSEALHDQICHHCIRIAWRRHARTGDPVRSLLHLVAANAYTQFLKAVPSEEPEYDQDLLEAYVIEAQRKNEVYFCFGFFVRSEYVRICDAAVAYAPRELMPPQSIFATVPHHKWACLLEQPSRLHAGHAALLKLREFWDAWERRVATDPLTRETVRIVTAATGDDPSALQAFFLDSRLSMLESMIEQSGIAMRHNQADVSVDRFIKAGAWNAKLDLE